MKYTKMIVSKHLSRQLIIIVNETLKWKSTSAYTIEKKQWVQTLPTTKNSRGWGWEPLEDIEISWTCHFLFRDKYTAPSVLSILTETQSERWNVAFAGARWSSYTNIRHRCGRSSNMLLSCSGLEVDKKRWWSVFCDIFVISVVRLYFECRPSSSSLATKSKAVLKGATE